VKKSMTQKACLVVMLVLSVFISSLPGYARAAMSPVDLGAAASFGGFGAGAGMTNQGIFTVVNGDIGTTGAASLVTGFHDTGANVYTETPLDYGTVNGTIHTATTPLGSVAGAIAAAVELATQTAYDNLSPAALPGGIDVSSLGGGAGELGSRTLYPGIYASAPGSFAIQGGDLYLDAQGDPNAVWVFQMASTLTVGGPGAAFPQSVLLVNGAQAKNVFWQVGSTATINAAGGGTMVGTIIAHSGAAFSTAGNVNIVTLEGRALALHASVTLVNTIINVPSTAVAPATGASITASKVGAIVTATANGQGGSGTYQYQFYQRDPNTGVWSMVQDYQSTNTWVWDTTVAAPGTYKISVYVRNAGSTAAYEAIEGGYEVTIASTGPATGAIISAANEGAIVTATASGQGGSGTYEYQYYQHDPNTDVWTMVQDYTGTNTYAWNTTTAASGLYTISVYVRSAGSSAPFDMTAATTVIIAPSGPATGATITVAEVGAKTGAIVTATANGQGGSGTYEYQFYQRDPATGVWSLVQDYTGANTYVWNTSAAAPGTYTISAYVRSAGSAAAFEATAATTVEIP